jgi:heme/copper-type cytochrome/quinol oxidase subunit 4
MNNDINEIQQDFEVLKYFQDEFQYRHKHFWNVMIKLFVLDVVILLLPFSTEIFGISLAPIKPEYIVCFPVFGALIAILTFIILNDEAKKISAVNKAKYRIARGLPEKYHYENYAGNMDDKRKQLAFSLTKFVLAVELIMVIIVLAYCIR